MILYFDSHINVAHKNKLHVRVCVMLPHLLSLRSVIYNIPLAYIWKYEQKIHKYEY